ncbi:MAG: ribosome maturation factor RimP [Nocardioides sp.]|nr:ribosome maturation factor RimP [Nocardioides sp.]
MRPEQQRTPTRREAPQGPGRAPYAGRVGSRSRSDTLGPVSECGKAPAPRRPGRTLAALPPLDRQPRYAFEAAPCHRTPWTTRRSAPHPETAPAAARRAARPALPGRVWPSRPGPSRAGSRTTDRTTGSQQDQGEIALIDKRKDAIANAIESELTEPLQALGLDVEAVEITPAGKRRILRVAVDKDGGVTLDDVADATREVGRVLDESDVMGEQPYTLEVTSRGVERPLTLPRHWRRNAGRLVKVTGADGATYTGRVKEHDEEPDGGVVLEISGKRRTVPYAQVKKALVQIEFKHIDEGE